MTGTLAMSPNRKTGYGVFDLTRQVARRVQAEWEAVENPPRPPHLFRPAAPSPAVSLPPRPRPRPPLAA